MRIKPKKDKNPMKENPNFSFPSISIREGGHASQTNLSNFSRKIRGNL